MKEFKYKAFNKEGQIQNGVVKANSPDEVIQVLKKNDLNATQIEEIVSNLSFGRLNEINIGGIPLKEKVVFMRQLSTMLSAGITLTGALDILVQQIDNKGFKKAVGDVSKKVTEGIPFSKALQYQENVFDSITISLIEAGEESGKLEEILYRIADELEKRQEFEGKMKSAMIYPIIMLTTVVVVIAIVMVYMVPQVAQMFTDFGGELPLLTKIVIQLSNFTVKYKFILLFLILGSIIFIRYFYKTSIGKPFMDKLALRLPIFGKLIQAFELANFTRTMTLLIKSGMDIVDIMTLTSKSINNYWIKQGLVDAILEVKKGVAISLPLSQNKYYPPLISRMIAVGEETGKLDVVLEKLNEYYAREVKYMTDNLASLMEPVMILVLGGVVGFIAIAVYGPMFSLWQLVGT